MNKEEYAAYRLTDEWKTIRRAALSEYGHRCQVCGCTSWRRIVDVHHLHYRNVGNEQILDLIPLCSIHHEMIHNQPDGYDMPVIQRLRRECEETYWNDPLPKHFRETLLSVNGHPDRASSWYCDQCHTMNDMDVDGNICEGCGSSPRGQSVEKRRRTARLNAETLGITDAIAMERTKSTWSKAGDVRKPL